MYQKECIIYNHQNGELFSLNSITNPTINNIVNKWNSQKHLFVGLATNNFKVDFIFHNDPQDFETQTNYSNVPNKKPYDFAQDNLKYINRKNNVPIIHIFPYNIFAVNEVYRYKKVVDSSIWNHYLFGNTIDELIKKLKEPIKLIGAYYDEKRYSLGLAHEYCDLHARMVEQSHLYDNSPHQDISPFLFHSEQEMHKKIDDFENENEHRISIDTIREYRWRFLLLDDKSGERMKDSEGEPVIDICKLQIVANNLRLLGFSDNQIWFRAPDFHKIRYKHNNRILDENGCKYTDSEEPEFNICGRVKNGRFDNGKTKFQVDFETPDIPDDIQIVIDCVKHVDAAQYCLQTYKYEIVLLDYLLDKDKVFGKQEYGYHLLRELYDWHTKKRNRAKKGNPDKILDHIYQPGPNGRFFFMFISAYTTAVHERLLAEGFPKSEHGLWFIGEGACPTNTPNLFAYLLLLLMRSRIKDLSRANEGNFLTLIELLKEIFVDETERDTLTDIRERAHDHFNHLLFMRDKYKQLENDMLEDEEKTVKTGKDIMNMHSSLLVQSAFKRVHHFSGSMFEHLQHLVYLTAFGTIRQWTELWEEYVFIHKKLLQHDTLTGSTDGLRINKAIRNYIIQLKENSN